MQKKLTVKDILGFRGKRKLTEIYTHTVLEAEACESAGIDMIITSELNDYERIRSAAPNTFFTVGLSYGCLLYTSPSPRDKRQSRMPSSA